MHAPFARLICVFVCLSLYLFLYVSDALLSITFCYAAVLISCIMHLACLSVRLSQTDWLIVCDCSCFTLIVASSADCRAARCHSINQLATTASISLQSANTCCLPTSTLAASVFPAHDCWNLNNTQLTLYPTVLAANSSTDVQQLLNSVGPVQQFPLVDILRMSSVGPSLLLTPTHSLLTTPPGVQGTLQPMSLCVAAADCNFNGAAATQQILAVQHDQLANVPSVGLLPCSNVNALLTTATAFHAQLLPSLQPPLIGCECVAAGQRVIGCDCCESQPMTGVVCLQSPVTSHWWLVVSQF